MPAAVVVDISGAEPPPAYVATLLGACSSALREGSCERAEPALSRPAAALLVHVVTNDELHFELLVDADDAHPAVSRALVFRSADAVEERWRSVGLSLASLAGEARPAPEPEPAKSPPVSSAKPGPSPSRPAPSTPSTPSVDAWRVGAGLQTGQGASDAPPRLGGYLSLSHGLPLKATFGLVTARYAVGHAPGPLVELEWATFGAGAGVALSREPVALRLQAAALAQLVAASASDRVSGQSSSAGRWLAGGLLGLELGWPGRGPLGALLGAEVARLSGGTAVRLNQRAVAESPGLQWAFLVGLEYRP